MALVYRSLKLGQESGSFTLKEYYNKRNTILVIRQTGGVGDILMSRMIFEDIKKLIPNCKIVYAIPPQYHQIMWDHPYIDEVIDHRNIDTSQYTITYNISVACGVHEQKVAPFSDKHRSDIWANHCGFNLTSHNMHINLEQKDIDYGKTIIEKHRGKEDKPVILFSPISAMSSKNLDREQMIKVVEGVQQLGAIVLGLHSIPIREIPVPTISGHTLLQWLSIINAADYIVSVDSAAFHASNGLNKPTTGIFTWADGKIYGKYHEKFILVQKHRDDGDWACGPCYCWTGCPFTKANRKPCVTQLQMDDVIAAVKQMMEKWTR